LGQLLEQHIANASAGEISLIALSSKTSHDGNSFVTR